MVTSALKMGEDSGVILRVYEAAGKPTPGVRIKLTHRALSAFEVNLIEQPIQKLSLQGDSLSFDLRPYEIKTFRIELSKLN